VNGIATRLRRTMKAAAKSRSEVAINERIYATVGGAEPLRHRQQIALQSVHLGLRDATCIGKQQPQAQCVQR